MSLNLFLFLCLPTGRSQVNPGWTSQKVWNWLKQGEHSECVFVSLWGWYVGVVAAGDSFTDSDKPRHQEKSHSKTQFTQITNNSHIYPLSWVVSIHIDLLCFSSIAEISPTSQFMAFVISTKDQRVIERFQEAWRCESIHYFARKKTKMREKLFFVCVFFLKPSIISTHLFFVRQLNEATLLWNIQTIFL